MSPNMGKQLRRAPYAEWVLMYRLGLSRKRIAALVGAEPSTVGYHLVIARRGDPDLEAAHLAAAGSGHAPSSAALARMGEVIAWVVSEGRFPRDSSKEKCERSMSRWLSDRRHAGARGSLHVAYGKGLDQIPGWDTSPRAAAEKAKWHQRLADLVEFRAEGNDWPRHKEYDSEREHILGLWLHSQRQKRRRGDLGTKLLELLDTAVPGWQAGRTRGRPPRR